MRWAVQVSVVLVNIVWILLFFTTDDFSETVWRRSAELPHVDVSLNRSSSTVTSEENKTLKAQTSKPEAETPIMDDYETTSRPPDPGLTSTGVVSTESSAPFRVVVNNKPEEDDHRNVPTPESLSSSECSAENVITTTPSTTGRVKVLENCCFKFYPRRMSKDKIVSYSMTDERCPKIAVILQTQKSKKICADPNLSWVEGIMKHLDEKSF